MELANSSKAWVTIDQSTQHLMSENLNLYLGCCTDFPGELYSYSF